MTGARTETAAPREHLLEREAATRAALEEIAEFLRNAHGAYANRLQQHLRRHERDLLELRERYLTTLPRVLLARCPFSGAEAHHSLDTASLHGLWWRADRPVRPLEEAVPPTWLAMTGALSLAQPTEATRFLVRPGPAVPGVLPRLLGHESVAAVVSEVLVGRHRGFALTYFEEQASGVPPVNTWGASAYRVVEDGGGVLEAKLPATDDEFDFELGPWIERGKLSWIAPGDETAELRSDINGCPYLDLDGTRETQYLEGGAVWTASTIEARSDR